MFVSFIILSVYTLIDLCMEMHAVMNASAGEVGRGGEGGGGGVGYSDAGIRL